MIPDFDRAATKALEVLIKYGVNTAPIDPIPIFKRAKGFNVVTFAEMSNMFGVSRKQFVSSLETENHDAFTVVYMKDNKPHYLVAYNMRLPQYTIQRALAREMAHIVLNHDGSLPEDIRNAEAICFARHLLCPRPLIHAIQETGTNVTVEVRGNITGCYERCLIGMRKTPATHVSSELNKAVKEQFKDYIEEFLDFQSFLSQEDDSMIANFGTFMDGYCEE